MIDPRGHIFPKRINQGYLPHQICCQKGVQKLTQNYQRTVENHETPGIFLDVYILKTEGELDEE